MCWCRSEVRTPFCGRAECHPLGGKSITLAEALDRAEQQVVEAEARRVAAAEEEARQSRCLDCEELSVLLGQARRWALYYRRRCCACPEDWPPFPGDEPDWVKEE